MINPFKLIGIFGLLLITAGVIIKDRKSEDILYVIGALCLEMYSIYIGDWLFIILQFIFAVAAIYDFIKRHVEKHVITAKK